MSARTDQLDVFNLFYQNGADLDPLLSTPCLPPTCRRGNTFFFWIKLNPKPLLDPPRG